MATTSLEELREFHQFVGGKLKLQDAPLSPEEALDQWRQQHPDERSAAEDVAAIQEALNDLANGDQGMFQFDDMQILILRLRGPGQAPVRQKDLPKN